MTLTAGSLFSGVGMSVEQAELRAKAMAGETLPPVKLIDAHIEVASVDPHTGVMVVKFVGGYCPSVAPGAKGRMVMHAAAPEMAGVR